MKLNEDQLSHAMKAFGCVESQNPTEGRGRIRVPMGTRTTIIPCNDAVRGEIATVVVLNLSDTGIGILNAVPMRAGESFIFRMPAGPTRPASAILCSVMYSQSIPNEMFAIGAQFVRFLATRAEPQNDQFTTPDNAELHSRDVDHVREVEARLSRLCL